MAHLTSFRTSLNAGCAAVRINSNSTISVLVTDTPAVRIFCGRFEGGNFSEWSYYTP